MSCQVMLPMSKSSWLEMEEAPKEQIVSANPYSPEKLESYWEDVREGGKKAADAEKAMPILEAFKIYRKAIMWASAIALSTVMEGYDESLIGSFFALPAFRKNFGSYYGGDAGWQLEAKWQSALGMISPIGVVIGLLINGYTLERFGYKKIILSAYIGVVGFVFMTFFATNKPVLLLGELFCCVFFGMLGSASLGYASETTPLALRSYQTMACNVTFTLGHTIRAAIMLAFVNNDTQWAYRIPFAIQWAWPVPLFILAALAPENPWWLIRNGKHDAAKKSLARLSSGLTDEELENTVAMMLHTHERERELEYGTSYLECFKGVDLRRTEVAVVGWAVQALCGFGGPGGSYFMESVGFDAGTSYWFGFIGQAIALAGDFTAWMLVGKVGRRTLYLWGVTYITLQWYVIGFLDLAPESMSGARWGQAVLVMVEGYIYDVTVGPLAFTVASEFPSTRLRAKTISLARSCYYVISIIGSVISPYELNPTAWNMKGKSAFIAAVCSTFSLVWIYFRMPESKNRTFEELDILFDKRISAREFAKTPVDAYGEDDTVDPLRAAEQTLQLK